jgi:hypothetical protein
MEEELYQKALSISADAMCWADLDPAEKEPPPEWIHELGPEAAARRFRVARAAWMSSRDAPIGLKLAHNAVVGIMKARAVEKQGPKILNATLVQMVGPLPEFPERLVKE